MKEHLCLLALFGSASFLTPTPSRAQIVQNGAAASSPLAQYPGFGHNPQADRDRYLREETNRQQMIAQCMQAAAFPYTPVTPVQPQRGPVGLQARRPLTPDQNERYSASLSAEQRTRFYLALYGVPNPNSEQASELWDPRSKTGGGCWGDALRAVPGVYAARSQLAEQYIDMVRSVFQDSRVVLTEQKWVVCMRGRGHSYTSLRAVAAEADSAAVRHQATPEFVLRHEQAVQAARECVSETGVNAAITQARADREAEFVNAHRALLDQHLARLRAQPGGSL